MKKIITGGITIFAFGMVCVNAISVPRAVEGILDKTTKQVVQWKIEELSMQKSYTSESYDPEAELRAYFDATMSQEEYDFFVQVGIRSAIDMLDGWASLNSSSYQIDRASNMVYWDDGSTEKFMLSEPSVESFGLTDGLYSMIHMLDEQYLYDGLRPESTLKCEVGEDDELYYNPESGRIYFPKVRTVQEEDALQYVDFGRKLAYVAYKENGVLQTEEAMRSRKGCMTQDEALKRTADILQQLCGEDIQDLYVTLEYKDDADISDCTETLTVSVAPYRPQSQWMQGVSYQTYRVTFDAFEHELLWYEAFLTNDPAQPISANGAINPVASAGLGMMLADAAEDQEIIHAVSEACDIAFSSGEPKALSIWYFKGDDDTHLNRFIDFLVYPQDGSKCYRVSYDAANRRIDSINVLSMEYVKESASWKNELSCNLQ